jgi:23S rRNA pseudouridine1911/1915/1917 synthase
LDKGTSGVIVVAKSDSAHLSMTRQFKNRSVKKVYTAMVLGKLREDEGQIDMDIGRHKYDRKKMSTHSTRGRAASTRWVVKSRFTGFSLLDVTIQTGRTHQIRVHLASLHHPILGDGVYGNKKMLSRLTDTTVRAHCRRLKRPFLHARLLGFKHPQNGEYLEFESPLPFELKELLSIIEKAG